MCTEFKGAFGRTGSHTMTELLQEQQEGFSVERRVSPPSIAPHSNASASSTSPHPETTKDGRDRHRLRRLLLAFSNWCYRRLLDSIARLLVQLQSVRSKWTCKHRGKQRLVSQGCREIHEASVYDSLTSCIFSRTLCENEKLHHDLKHSQ